MNKNGFTLVEIMIVVAIIGLLAMVAIPSFIKARNQSQTKACINNLRIIDGAKEMCAIEYGGANGALLLTPEAMLQYIKGNDMPVCPVGETEYIINVVGTPPMCDAGLAGHVL